MDIRRTMVMGIGSKSHRLKPALQPAGLERTDEERVIGERDRAGRISKRSQKSKKKRGGEGREDWGAGF